MKKISVNFRKDTNYFGGKIKILILLLILFNTGHGLAVANRVTSAILNDFDGILPVYGTSSTFRYELVISSDGGSDASSSFVSLSGAALPAGMGYSFLSNTLSVVNGNEVLLPAFSPGGRIFVEFSTAGAGACFNITPPGSYTGVTFTLTSSPGPVESSTLPIVIAKKNLTIASLTAENKIYDGNTDATFTGGVLSGIVCSDDVSFIAAGSFLDENVETNKSILANFTLSGTHASRYNLIQPTKQANITAKEVVIQIDDLSKCEGSAAVYTNTNFSATGLLGTDVVNSISINCPFDTPAEPAGVFVVNGSNPVGTGLSNYYFVFEAGELTIQNCTELIPAHCGLSLNLMEKVLNYNAIPGASNYEILVEGPGPYSQNVVRGNNSTNFKMSWFSGLAYNTTYTVTVRAYVGSAWTNYGDACNITTPTFPLEPKLNSGSCGATLTTLNDVLNYRTIYEATNYEIWVQGPDSYTSTKLRNNNLTNFKMSWFSGLKYATTYTVKIRAYVNGSWTSFGGACNVTTPAIPTTQLIPGDCGTTLAAYDEILEYNAVSGASNYEIWVEGPGAYSSTVLRNSNKTTFRLSWFSGLTINTTYTVKVRSYINGVWSAYGNACNVTTAGSLSLKVIDEEHETFKGAGSEAGLEDFSLETYPNPSNGTFTVSSTNGGSFVIINELGQNVKTIELTKDLNYKLTIENMEKGVYFVTGISNNKVLTKKIIVQ